MPTCTPSTRSSPTSGAVDAIWHLGDIVGYGPEPDGVVERLAGPRARIGVRGNHDAAAAGGNEIDWFNADARAAMEWTRRTISSTTMAWLRGPPGAPRGSRLHAGPRQPARSDLGVRDHDRCGPAENLAAITTTHGLNGHTHVPIAFSLEGDRMERARAAERGNPGVELDGRRLAAQPGQRRAAARRRPAGELPGPRPRGAPRPLGPRRLRHRRGPRRGCARSGLPSRLSERLRHGF